MENAADALKIAFGILIFVLALAMSISCFSMASSAVDAMVTLRDREANYTYLNASKGLERTVSAETIVPTLYKAYYENFKVVFYKLKADEETMEPLPLYKETDAYNNITGKEINYIDLVQENFGYANGKSAIENAVEHLNILLEGHGTRYNAFIGNDDKLSQKKKYDNQMIERNGDYSLYNYLKKHTFIEKLGEYYQEDAESLEKGTVSDLNNVQKTKKRVITYILEE